MKSVSSRMLILLALFLIAWLSRHDALMATQNPANFPRTQGNGYSHNTIASYCEANYRTLTASTIPLHKRIPTFTPIMITAPFAGMVTAREMMEYGTGFYSGSFGDPHIKGYSHREFNKAKEFFYREGNCTYDTSVVALDEFERAFLSDRGTFAFSFAQDRLKCRRGLIYNFAHFVIVIRNPYEIILREYEDQYSEEVQRKSGDPSSPVDYESKIDFASEEGKAAFRKHAIPAAERLQKFTEKFVSWFAEMVLHNILFVQYEDLVDVTKQHALALAMTSITMRRPPDQFLKGDDTKPSRVECVPYLLRHQDHDKLHTYRYEGAPFGDPVLVAELAKLLNAYATTFHYSKLPPAMFVEPQAAQTQAQWPTFSSAVSSSASTGGTGAGGGARMVTLQGLKSGLGAGIGMLGTSVATASSTSGSASAPSSGASSTAVAGGGACFQASARKTPRVSTYNPQHSEAVNAAGNFPPLLYGLKAGGGLVLRELVEKITGTVSGTVSTLRETEQNQLFSGPASCTTDVSVVYTDTPSSFFVADNGKVVLKKKTDRNGCSTKALPPSSRQQAAGAGAGAGGSSQFSANANSAVINRIIVLVRNPFDAILAAYETSMKGLLYAHQFTQAAGSGGNTQAPGRLLEFPSSQSEYSSADSIRTTNWHSFAQSQSQFLVNEWLQQLTAIFANKQPQDVTILKYEDIFGSDEGLAQAVNKLLKMVYPNKEGFKSSTGAMGASDRDVRCLHDHLVFRHIHSLNSSLYLGHPYADDKMLSGLAQTLQPILKLFDYTFANSVSYGMTVNRPGSPQPPPPAPVAVIAPPLPSPVAKTPVAASPPTSPSTGVQTTVPVTAAVADTEAPKELTEDDLNRIKNLKRAECGVRYSRRQFCSKPKESRTPPMLLSFPGAGNTWMRLLIEIASGYFTGSIYNRDVMLDRDFFAERHCSQELSAVKVHPQDIEWRPHPNPHKSIILRERAYRLKCTAGNVKGFSRIILAVRNPFSCILSEYHRQQNFNSHNAAVSVSDFNRSTFNPFALRSAKEYNTLWKELLTPLLESALPILVVRYEDMLDKNLRLDLLDKIDNFISRDTDSSCLGSIPDSPQLPSPPSAQALTVLSSPPPPPSMSGSVYGPPPPPHTNVHALPPQVDRFRPQFFNTSDSEVRRHRLECAFMIGDTRRTHRATSDSEAALPRNRKVDAKLAFDQDPQLVADMWAQFKEYAEYFRYTMDTRHH